MILNANALHIPLADNSVQCVVTSPPYYGLRDYGTAKWRGGKHDCNHNPQRPDGGARADRTLPLGRGGMYRDICSKCGAVRIDDQIGLEQSPEAYVANLVAVFREVWRVLRDDGTLWLNLGDSYNSIDAGKNPGGFQGKQMRNDPNRNAAYTRNGATGKGHIDGLKPKDLIGIPWRVAFALQADGWYLRSDVIWSKPNPMPESVTDRPTKAHEYLFLLTKSARYYFDQDAVREELSQTAHYGGTYRNNGHSQSNKRHPDGHIQQLVKVGTTIKPNPSGRNIRTVWTIATQPTSYAHFATFPEKLVEPCIKAGTSERGCCPKCGKPWVRVTENNSNWLERKDNGAGSGNDVTGHNTEHGKGMSHYLYSNRKFIGWQPACACDAGEPVPCVVFDPFAGSGTVERVAIRLRRRSIGTELNYQYISEIVSKRTADIQPVIF